MYVCLCADGRGHVYTCKYKSTCITYIFKSLRKTCVNVSPSTPPPRTFECAPETTSYVSCFVCIFVHTRMYVYIYVHMCEYTYTDTNEYTCTIIYIYMCTYSEMYTCIYDRFICNFHSYIHVCTHPHTLKRYACAIRFMYILLYTCRYMYICSSTHTYMYMYTYIHRYMYKHLNLYVYKCIHIHGLMHAYMIDLYIY